MNNPENDTTRYFNDYPDFTSLVRRAVNALVTPVPIVDLKGASGFERRVYYKKVGQRYFVTDFFGDNIKVYSGEDLLENRRPSEVTSAIADLSVSPGVSHLSLPLILSFNTQVQEHYTEQMICDVLSSTSRMGKDLDTLRSENPMFAKYEYKEKPFNLGKAREHYQSVVQGYLENSLWISNTADLIDFMKAVDVSASKNVIRKTLTIGGDNFAESGYDENFVLNCNKSIAANYDGLVGALIDNLESTFAGLEKLPSTCLDNSLWLEKDGNRLVSVNDTAVLVIDKLPGKGTYEFYYREFDSVPKFISDIDSGNFHKLGENVISLKDYVPTQIQEFAYDLVDLMVQENYEKLDNVNVVVNKERNFKLN